MENDCLPNAGERKHELNIENKFKTLRWLFLYTRSISSIGVLHDL